MITINKNMYYNKYTEISKTSTNNIAAVAFILYNTVSSWK